MILMISLMQSVKWFINNKVYGGMHVCPRACELGWHNEKGWTLAWCCLRNAKKSPQFWRMLPFLDVVTQLSVSKSSWSASFPLAVVFSESWTREGWPSLARVEGNSFPARLFLSLRYPTSFWWKGKGNRPPTSEPLQRDLGLQINACESWKFWFWGCS